MAKRVPWALVPLTTVVWLLLAVPVWAQGNNSEIDPLLLSAGLAWLVPIGLGMLACGTVPPERTPAVMRVGWLSLGLAVTGYWLCGFAFQFGGVGFVSDHRELAGLAREWTLSGLDRAWGSQWGVIGLEGYMLRGPASAPAALGLFWAQLPWITTAVALFLWSLQARTWPVRSGTPRTTESGPGMLLVLGGLLQAMLYALIGNWAWGGGWLASLGLNLGLGHGFVDYGGGVVHLLAATSALVAMMALPARRSASAAPRRDARQLALPTLSEPGVSAPDVRWTVRDEPYVPMPALHLPVLATAGAWLAVLGWVGWSISTPSLAAGIAVLPWPEPMIGLLMAAAGGALCALLSSWLTTGEGNALMTARGVVGALVAVSAGLPFYSLWAALAIGAGAGLVVPLVQYVIDHLLRLEDATSAVAVHGVSALWGLLAVGLLADGQSGSGWNGVGETTYRGVQGQGVSGLVVGSGWAGDWPGQFQAQAFGAAAVVAIALLATGLVIGLARAVMRAWYGETSSVPAAPSVRARKGGRARPGQARLVRAERGKWRWPQIGSLVLTWVSRRASERPQESAGQEHAEWSGAPPELESFDDSPPEVPPALVPVDDSASAAPQVDMGPPDENETSSPSVETEEAPETGDEDVP